MPITPVSPSPSSSAYEFENVPALTKAVEHSPGIFQGRAVETTVGSRRYLINCITPAPDGPDNRGICEAYLTGSWRPLALSEWAFVYSDREKNALIKAVERLNNGSSTPALPVSQGACAISSPPSPPPTTSPMFVLPSRRGDSHPRRSTFGRTFLELNPDLSETATDPTPESGSIGFRPPQPGFEAAVSSSSAASTSTTTTSAPTQAPLPIHADR